MTSPTNLVTDAYAGALLFVAFLAEMRNPMDFWKGLFCAQAFICIVYLLFGIFVYSFWGQYSANNIVNVIRPYPLQTAGNVFTLLTGFIAVCKCRKKIQNTPFNGKHQTNPHQQSCTSTSA
jgi:hypothetical protein